MKILFITDNFYPERNAPAKRTYEHAIEWIKLNHEISIVTGVPNFPKGKVFNGYKNKIFQSENLDGINIYRVWTFIAANKGFIFRILDYISFMFTSFLAGLFLKKHDVIIATSPQFFTAISGWLISFFRKKPFILEIRDLWPESIVAVGAMNNKNIIIKFFHKVACFLYRKADCIICVTHSFKKDLVKLNVNENKILVIENGIKIENLISPNKTIDMIEKEYNLSKKDFIISFIGTVGMAHGLDIIIRAAKKINNEKIKFLIVGEGAEKEKLKLKVSSNNLDNVLIVDSISWQEIININQIISANFIHLKKSDIFKKVIPSKIFESMAMKKTIILGVEGEAENIINHSKCGLVIEPDNEDSLISAIDFLNNIKDLETMKAYGQNGYNYVINNYNRVKLANKMINFIFEKK